ncbi:MAG: hypothetical protein NTY19_18520 [Planctomycetota bacterium]|nr:hypothetical protein [Planctomycetota bacterium]
MTPPSIEATYQQRRDASAAAEQRYALRDRLLTHSRMVAFLVVFTLFGLGCLSDQGRSWYVAGGLAAGGFLALVTYHEHILRELTRHRLLRQINAQAIARLHRDWTALPETPVEVPREHRATALDLDLFGHASIFHFLCSAKTPAGIRVLRDWLLEPAAPDEIRRRQAAVVELAPCLQLRQTLILEGLLLADRGNTAARFLEWAEDSPWLAARPWLLWLCRSTPVALVVTLGLIACGMLPLEQGLLAAFLILAWNFLVCVFFTGRVHDIFSMVNSRASEVRRYLNMFELMVSMPDSTSELDSIKREATTHGGGVLLRLRQLHRISSFSNIHHSALLFIFIYLPLQFVFLVDFHVLNLLEAWQQRYGKYVGEWFLALGKFEALSSLATLVYDHPDWTLPEIDAAADRFQACQLGHPLLPEGMRVANDVELGPAGSVLLVTGSNMSGKSTLLRAIGVNAALAQAGAPVCAERLVMPPASLATSMRIRDSLEEGVSFFMAELMRLKQVVDLARDAPRRHHRTLLYLLDEILLGTNSRERQIAVVRVLQVLLQHGAIGAVSTHDLDLATRDVNHSNR